MTLCFLSRYGSWGKYESISSLPAMSEIVGQTVLFNFVKTTNQEEYSEFKPVVLPLKMTLSYILLLAHGLGKFTCSLVSLGFIGIMVRVFANRSEDQGSIPG